MRQQSWMILIGIGLVLLFGTGIIVVALYLGKAVSPSPTPKRLIGPLTHHQSVVGEWDRIEFPEAVIPVCWRKFLPSGKMTVCYGDEICQGSYKILDKQTIETRYHFFEQKDEVHRWTFGFENGNLVMIHQDYGWVEKYRMVPVGTLQP